jgi:hypothetical protein
MWGPLELPLQALVTNGYAAMPLRPQALVQKALLLRRGEQEAMPGAPGKALAQFGNQAVSRVEQGAWEPARSGGEARVNASDIGCGMGYGIELDEGLTVLDPQQRLDALETVLGTQGEAEGGVARNKEQVGAALVGEDELHGTMAEGAVSVKDEHGSRHGRLDENGAVGGAVQGSEFRRPGVYL